MALDRPEAIGLHPTGAGTAWRAAEAWLCCLARNGRSPGEESRDRPLPAKERGGARRRRPSVRHALSRTAWAARPTRSQDTPAPLATPTSRNRPLSGTAAAPSGAKAPPTTAEPRASGPPPRVSTCRTALCTLSLRRMARSTTRTEKCPRPPPPPPPDTAQRRLSRGQINCSASPLPSDLSHKGLREAPGRLPTSPHQAIPSGQGFGWEPSPSSVSEVLDCRAGSSRKNAAATEVLAA